MCAGAGHAQGLYLKPTRVLGQVAEIRVRGQGSSTCDLPRLFGEDWHPYIVVSKPNEWVVLCVFCSDELIWCSLW